MKSELEVRIYLGREGREARIFTGMFDEIVCLLWSCFGGEGEGRGGHFECRRDGWMDGWVGWSVRGAGMKGVGGI